MDDVFGNVGISLDQRLCVGGFMDPSWLCKADGWFPFVVSKIAVGMHVIVVRISGSRRQVVHGLRCAFKIFVDLFHMLSMGGCTRSSTQNKARIML